MITSQHIYQDEHWGPKLQPNHNAQLVLLFGGRKLAADKTLRSQIASQYPNAEIIGCTTSGEILDIQIYDESLCLTAIEFNSSQVECRSPRMSGPRLITLLENCDLNSDWSSSSWEVGR